ncbi:hypothetical protein CEXT_53371 [Caerostris extrusa]|uniref:Uncharacterized protein n=1 Tax=Caerostris extrusa TaxID=172846 RepID=A0AAV4URE9_CAEEX|nr:hypothetical protein CEXT_53371 [Caerostris extrusa]
MDDFHATKSELEFPEKRRVAPPSHFFSFMFLGVRLFPESPFIVVDLSNIERGPFVSVGGVFVIPCSCHHAPRTRLPPWVSLPPRSARQEHFRSAIS